ncbi:MAG: hypothetical protein ACXABY_28730 [Candidatus Thorarchaeota archaeon]
MIIMQPAFISIEQVYLESLALCFYQMGLNTLDLKYIYNLPWRAGLLLAQIMSVLLMFHAGSGIAWLVFTGMNYVSLSWVGLWFVLTWINRSRIKGIIKGKRTNRE